MKRRHERHLRLKGTARGASWRPSLVSATSPSRIDIAWSSRLAAMLLITLAGCGMTWSSRCLGAEYGKPNVVVILADDLGWGDVSCNQPEGKIRTPEIDALAAEGMRFTNAHAPHSVCTPSRYSLLTGRYCWRTFVREGVLPGYAKPLIPPSRTTIASALKQQGYATGAFGKWHIGLKWRPVDGDPGDFHFGSQLHGPGANKSIAELSQRVDHTVPINGGPLAIGFDTFFGTPSNCTRIPVFMRDDRVIHNPKRDETGLIRDPALDRSTVDDLYVEEAAKFINASTTEGKPFFVYLALNAAHGAVLPPKRFVGQSGIGARADRCLWVDESVGKVRRILEDAGAAENTLVIFTSDNGPKYTKSEITKSKHDASGPYRGFKTDAWEGGTRVPFVVRWPGKVEAGQVNSNLMCLTDLLPTVASIAGITLPRWAAEDGIDQTAQLTGADVQPTRNSMITQSYTGILSIRRGKWKLIFDTLGSGGFFRYSAEVEPMGTIASWRPDLSRSGQLYDLSTDPFEQSNRYSEEPAVVNALTEEMLATINSGLSHPSPKQTTK
jgi:arylsulfatase A